LFIKESEKKHQKSVQGHFSLCSNCNVCTIAYTITFVVQTILLFKLMRTFRPSIGVTVKATYHNDW